jgi:diguanylate cyclase (GGDEF)-like protein
MYAKSMNMMIKERTGMTNDFPLLPSRWEEAVSRLDYAYQPIVNGYTGEVFGYEALLRNWERCGFSGIFDVFDSAFRERILYTLDLALRRKAIRKISPLEGIEQRSLFYNLDNRVLEMPDYSPGNTLELLSETGINKSHFYFELSERHEFASYEETIQILEQYKGQNFRIAIDDYGSGYSGMQLLYHSEPDVIKIDRFFIDGVHSDQKKKLFAEQIVEMAHLMGIKVVAEGIETERELMFCRDIGCDYLQGYYLARPETDLNRLKSHYDLDKGAKTFRRRRGDGNDGLLESRLTSITPVMPEDDGVMTLKRFQKDTNLTILPVVNRQNEPLGVIREKDLKQYVYSPYGISLFRKRSHTHGMQPFITGLPMAEANSSLERILDTTAAFNQTDGILITRDGQYLGVLEPSSLIQLIYEQKLAHARDQNPLTGLPGNYSILRKMTAILNERKSPARITFFDFNNFKPFNDSYGFRMGDRLIILFAEILKKTFNLSEDFIAHIGGDDFLVIQNRPEKDRDCALIRKAQKSFAENAQTYYSDEHRERGYMEAPNRRGRHERFDLISVAAGTLEIDEFGNETMDTVNRILSGLKKESKISEDFFAFSLLNTGKKSPGDEALG